MSKSFVYTLKKEAPPPPFSAKLSGGTASLKFQLEIDPI